MSTKSKKDYYPATNSNIAGLSFYSPYLEKLRLYQTYLSSNSIWENEKSELWENEKEILAWAASRKHQHLLSPLTTRKVADELFCGQKPDDLQHVFGNLVHKGFAEPNYFRDIADKIVKTIPLLEKKKENGKNSKEEINSLLEQHTDIAYKYYMSGSVINDNLELHSIIVNSKGILLGKLINEIKECKEWKYKWTINGCFYPLLFIISATAVLVFCKNSVEISEIIYNGFRTVVKLIILFSFFA